MRRLLTLALVLAVLLPMALGAALTPLAVALGASAAEHKCACGMVPGTCGCPECARLEQARLAERAPLPYAALRSACPRDEVAPGFAALPPAVVGPAHVDLASPWVPAVASLRPVGARSMVPRPPATPPPRSSIAS